MFPACLWSLCTTSHQHFTTQIFVTFYIWIKNKLLWNELLSCASDYCFILRLLSPTALFHTEEESDILMSEVKLSLERLRSSDAVDFQHEAKTKPKLNQNFLMFVTFGCLRSSPGVPSPPQIRTSNINRQRHVIQVDVIVQYEPCQWSSGVLWSTCTESVCYPRGFLQVLHLPPTHHNTCSCRRSHCRRSIVLTCDRLSVSLSGLWLTGVQSRLTPPLAWGQLWLAPAPLQQDEQ